MSPVLFSVSAIFLLICAFIVFRIFVRRDYQRKGRLTSFSSLLELLLFTLYMGFPFLYNPPCWPWFWSCETHVGYFLWITGVITVAVGMAIAFSMMAWLGIGLSFGRDVNGLHQTGLYRFTRNPQIMGGVLMVVGIAMLWPSWYALGWVFLYAVLSHTMVLTEEEHLGKIFGEEYRGYCKRTHRYVGIPKCR